MQWTEQAQLLLRKAVADAVIVSRGVADSGITDEILGFHVQQAAEKCLKAVLCHQGITYRRTHDLQELADLLIDAGASVPPEIADLCAWSPFAVAYRYEDWPPSSAIDREHANELTHAAIAWARRLIGP
jgi:HEPN domain-containing protein